MIKVIEVSSDSNIGGAGKCILTFLKTFDRQSFDVSVVVPKGSLLRPEIEELHTKVFEMEHLRRFVSYGVEELIHGGDFTELAGCRVKGRGKTFYWSLDRDDDRIVPNMPWNRRYGVTTHSGPPWRTDQNWCW